MKFYYDNHSCHSNVMTSLPIPTVVFLWHLDVFFQKRFIAGDSYLPYSFLNVLKV